MTDTRTRRSRYLLQRIEDFEGLVILASNLRTNIDDAFLRRFNAVIRFPFPDAAERERIWQRLLPESASRAALASRLSRFELTGGNSVNVVQFAGIEAIANGRSEISYADAVKGIKREMEKQGHVFRDLESGEGAQEIHPHG